MPVIVSLRQRHHERFNSFLSLPCVPPDQSRPGLYGQPAAGLHARIVAPRALLSASRWTRGRGGRDGMGWGGMRQMIKTPGAGHTSQLIPRQPIGGARLSVKRGQAKQRTICSGSVGGEQRRRRAACVRGPGWGWLGWGLDSRSLLLFSCDSCKQSGGQAILDYVRCFHTLFMDHNVMALLYDV